MPTAVGLGISRLLREAVESRGMDQFAFLRADEERARLIDHIGGCERILKTPLPIAYSIEIRQFIFVFLVSLPFGILDKVDWLTPLVTMLVAFPILALDEIGVELQNPFSTDHLNHLPLDEICHDLERNVMGLLADRETPWPVDFRIETGGDPLGTETDPALY
jgi:putative membrane protein